MATAYEALGKGKQALEFFQRAVQRKQSGSEVSYYQGLAFKKLGRLEEANHMFKELMAFSRQLLEKSQGLNFFAKFGKRQSGTKRKAQAHYLLGLAYLGEGRMKEAKAEFEKALKINPNHFKARRQLLSHFKKY